MDDKSTQFCEQLEKDISAPDFFLVVDIKNRMMYAGLYEVENGEYGRYDGWHRPDANRMTLQRKYCDAYFEDMSHSAFENNESIIRFYRFENHRFAEYRAFTDKEYDHVLYTGWKDVIFFREFGLLPSDEKMKQLLKENEDTAKKRAASLVYACYLNDTPLILERAEKAKKSELNAQLTGHFAETPLGICAANDNPEAFEAIAEKGANLTKKHNACSAIDIALRHSPRCAEYIKNRFPDVFNAYFEKRGFRMNIVRSCRSYEVLEAILDCAGDKGLEKAFFAFAEEDNKIGVQFAIDHGVDFRNIRDDYKRSALDHAPRDSETYKLLESLWQ